MKIHVNHALKTDVATVFRFCTELKCQESIYARMNVLDPKIRRTGRSPNVELQVTRSVPVNPPAALRRFVTGTSEVVHTESWRPDGKGYVADLDIDIRSVPVRITGTKALRPEKRGCLVEWNFDVTSGVPLLGKAIAGFAGEEIRKSLEDEFRALEAAV